jgi:hypothetical protein
MVYPEYRCTLKETWHDYGAEIALQSITSSYYGFFSSASPRGSIKTAAF